MSNKKSNIENLTSKKVEVTNNDTANYSHIKFGDSETVGENEADVIAVKGTVSILLYDEKVIGDEKSNIKRGVYNFTGRVVIHDGKHFAGMHVLTRDAVEAHHISVDSTDQQLEAVTLDLSGYESIRLNKIIRAEVAGAFYHQKASDVLAKTKA